MVGPWHSFPGEGIEQAGNSESWQCWKGGTLIVRGGIWPPKKLQCLLEGVKGSLQDTVSKPSLWGDSCPVKDASHPSSLHRWTGSKELFQR